jgi:hypothetical protein
VNSTKQLSDDEHFDRMHCDWLTTCIKYKHNVVSKKLIKNGHATKTWEIILKDIVHQPSEKELVNLADDGCWNFGGHIRTRHVNFKDDQILYYVDVYVD